MTPEQKTAIDQAENTYIGADNTFLSAHTADVNALALVAQDTVARDGLAAQITSTQSTLASNVQSESMARNSLRDFINTAHDPALDPAPLDVDPTFASRIAGWRQTFGDVQANVATIGALTVQLNAANQALATDTNAQVTGTSPAVIAAQTAKDSAFAAWKDLVDAANG